MPRNIRAWQFKVRSLTLLNPFNFIKAGGLNYLNLNHGKTPAIICYDLSCICRILFETSMLGVFFAARISEQMDSIRTKRRFLAQVSDIHLSIYPKTAIKYKLEVICSSYPGCFVKDAHSCHSFANSVRE
jgi:hypothetical protein